MMLNALIKLFYIKQRASEIYVYAGKVYPTHLHNIQKTYMIITQIFAVTET
jgi:hypothetical protein